MLNNLLYSYSSNNNYGYSTSTTSDFTFGTFLIILIALAIPITFGIIAKKEAEKQGRNATGWFFLGFFFSFNALIALKVSKAADEEGHDSSWWSFLGIIFGLGAIIAFEAGLNAENKQHDFDCWVFLGLVGGLIALFVSCFLKPFDKKGTVAIELNTKKDIPSTPANTWYCKQCGAKNLNSNLYCGVCSAKKD